MSQGDYIRYKRVATELVEQRKFDPVLASRKYINYKEFNIENTVFNNTPTHDKLIPANTAVVFGMVRNKSATCPSFILCRGTNARPNRKALLGVQSASQPLAKKPSHVTPNKLPLCLYCTKL